MPSGGTIALFILYMAPTIIAVLRSLPAWKFVLVVNFLLGWTVLSGYSPST
jgi:Superinfection immunity protein